VETLFNVPLIMSRGVKEYRQIGTEKSPGSKLFCVSGDVDQPGVYEVPFGMTLRQLLEMAGGLAGQNSLQAVLFGGAAGAFATSESLDVKLTFEDLRAAGLPLGSGVVMVFDDTRDLRDVLRRLGHFFAHESCGKCYPCQMGTRRQKEVLERLAAGRILDGDLGRLQDIGWTMTDASLCGLGQTAAAAVLSAIKLWPTMFSRDSAKVSTLASVVKEPPSGSRPQQPQRGKTRRAGAASSKRSVKKPAAHGGTSSKKSARRKR
jgi:NADH-quinone oxidoreductase subunit F